MPQKNTSETSQSGGHDFSQIKKLNSNLKKKAKENELHSSLHSCMDIFKEYGLDKKGAVEELSGRAKQLDKLRKKKKGLKTAIKLMSESKKVFANEGQLAELEAKIKELEAALENVNKEIRNLSPDNIGENCKEAVIKAIKAPQPRDLYGDMFPEGQCVVIAGDPSTGKSSLFYLIASLISGGRKHQKGVDLPVKQEVLDTFGKDSITLIFDLEQSQYATSLMFYSREHGMENCSAHYAKNIQLYTMTHVLKVAERLKVPQWKAVHNIIEDTVKSNPTKKVYSFVDNLTTITDGSASKEEDIKPIMKGFNQLVNVSNKENDLGRLSLFIVCHMLKGAGKRPIEISDIKGSRTIAKTATTVVALNRITNPNIINEHGITTYFKVLKKWTGEVNLQGVVVAKLAFKNDEGLYHRHFRFLYEGDRLTRLPEAPLQKTAWDLQKEKGGQSSKTSRYDSKATVALSPAERKKKIIAAMTKAAIETLDGNGKYKIEDWDTVVKKYGKISKRTYETYHKEVNESVKEYLQKINNKNEEKSASAK